MKSDIIIGLALMGTLVFVGAGLFYNASKACDVNIDYDVTVDSNVSNNFPNIAEVKLVCYKLCLENTDTFDGGSLQRDCMGKCEALE